MVAGRRDVRPRPNERRMRDTQELMKCARELSIFGLRQASASSPTLSDRTDPPPFLLPGRVQRRQDLFRACSSCTGSTELDFQVHAHSPSYSAWGRCWPYHVSAKRAPFLHPAIADLSSHLPRAATYSYLWTMFEEKTTDTISSTMASATIHSGNFAF